MDKIIIKRSQWYRGHGSERSALLRRDGRMCCLGFACQQLGASEGALLEAKYPTAARARSDGEEPRNLDAVQHLSRFLDENREANNAITLTMAKLNDEEGIDEAERETQLIELGKKLDLELVFED